MPEFRRIKVRAMLESEVMLLGVSDVQRTIDDIHSRLEGTGLKIVSLEPEEVITAPAVVTEDYRD